MTGIQGASRGNIGLAYSAVGVGQPISVLKPVRFGWGKPDKPEDNNRNDAPEPKNTATPKKKTWFDKVLRAMLILELALLGGYVGGNNYVAYRMQQEMREYAKNRLDPAKAKNPWPSNTKVYASTIQETSGYGVFGSFWYPDMLLKELDKDSVRTLDQAHQNLEGGLGGLNGLYYKSKGIAQVPVSSAREIKAWEKDVEKPRYALIITGDGNDDDEAELTNDKLAHINHFEKMFLAEGASVKLALQKHFKVPDRNIKFLVQPSVQDLEQGLQWLQEAQRNDPTAEALVYVAAHGNAFYDHRTPVDQIGLQGSTEGVIGLNSRDILFEADVKKMFNKYLSKYQSVSLIMAPCHSGAWVASKETVNPFLKVG